MFRSFWRDLVHAARSLARARAFTVVCVTSLGIGMVPIIGGRLGDDRGRRLMLQIGIASFVVFSAMVGLAPNPAVANALAVLDDPDAALALLRTLARDGVPSPVRDRLIADFERLQRATAAT